MLQFTKTSSIPIKRVFNQNNLSEESKVISENSVNLDFNQEDFDDYSTFYDNKDFLCKTQIKLIHSIILCNQKLYLYDEIIYYCDKILAYDSKDWVARLKRGLHYYLQVNRDKAFSDFKVAVEESPHRDILRIELEKLNYYYITT